MRGDIIVEQITSRSDSLSSLSQRGGEKINIFMEVSSSQSSDTEGYPETKADFPASNNKNRLRPKYEPKISPAIKPWKPKFHPKPAKKSARELKPQQSARDQSPLQNPLLIAKMLSNEDVFKPKLISDPHRKSRK